MNLNRKITLNLVFIFLFLLCFNFSNAQKLISGIITSEQGTPIENVVVSITGSLEESVFTDEDGYYEFSAPEGGSYTIRPSYNAHPLNGVSTFDKILLSEYIANQGGLNSPFKIIAADVDQDNSVGTSDTLTIHQIILSQILDFPNNTSWRFIVKGFIFPDGNNPFSTPFPEEGVANDLENDITINFTGVKVGDLNTSALTSLSPISDDCASNIVSNQWVSDQHFEIEAFPNPFENQFTIRLGKESKETMVEVYSSTGLQLSNGIYFNTDLITLDFDSGFTGVYFVKIVIADKTQWVSVVKG